MTPEQAEAIFYETYGEGNWPAVGKPVIQKELRDKCWQAVIDAVSKETCADIAKEYLDATEPLGKL